MTDISKMSEHDAVVYEIIQKCKEKLSYSENLVKRSEISLEQLKGKLSSFETVLNQIADQNVKEVLQCTKDETEKSYTNCAVRLAEYRHELEETRKALGLFYSILGGICQHSAKEFSFTDYHKGEDCYTCLICRRDI